MPFTRHFWTAAKKTSSGRIVAVGTAQRSFGWISRWPRTCAAATGSVLAWTAAGRHEGEEELVPRQEAG